MSTRTNEHGSIITQEFNPGSRYQYDHTLLPQGYEQYDTTEDAHYFGVWINPKTRSIFTYAEGDCITVTSPTQEAYDAEIMALNTYYGPPPPFMTTINLDSGSVTKHHQTRPTPQLELATA